MKEIIMRLLGIFICVTLCAAMVIFLWPALAEGWDLILYRVLTIGAIALLVVAIAKS